MAAADHLLNPEELMAYLDGELPVERAAMLQAHVSGCTVCQQLAEQLCGVSRDLRAWQVEEAPVTLRAPQLPGGAVARTPRERFAAWLPALGWQLAGAAAIILAVVALTYNTRALKFSQAEGSFPTASASLSRHDAPQSPRGGAGVRAGGPGSAGVPAGVPRAQDALAAIGQRPAPQPTTPPQVVSGPMIVRTATLRVVANNFEAVRPTVDRVLRDVGGFVGQIDVSTARGMPRSLAATLRVPAPRLDAALGALRQLGQVVEESQGGDDVTEQAIDLDARLANNRSTEKRLADLLQYRTGNVADVLAVEREVTRVRGEIERLDAERKNLDRRVTYATVTLQVDEERKAGLDLGPLSVTVRLRNALVDGSRQAFEMALGATLFVTRIAPTLLLWTLVLFWPARIFHRWRRGQAVMVSTQRQ